MWDKPCLLLCRQCQQPDGERQAAVQTGAQRSASQGQAKATGRIPWPLPPALPSHAGIPGHPARCWDP